MMRSDFKLDIPSHLRHYLAMEEIWKPVPSREGVQASSLGRILLPPREAAMPNGGVRTYNPKPRIGCKTKASKNSRHVYMNICTKHFGNMAVHRLVCEAFHGPAPTDQPIVLHLDEDATNNRYDNIRWGTQKENLNASGFIAYCKSRTGDNNPLIKGRKAKEA